MSRFLLFLLGLLLAALLAFFCIKHHMKTIPQMVGISAAQELAKASPQSASIAIDGRDVILNGYVSSQEEGNALVAKLSKAEGVRTVKNNLKIKAPAPVVISEPVIEEVIIEEPVIAAPTEEEIQAEKIVQCENALKSLMESRTIAFPSGSASMKQESYSLLQDIASEARNCPNTQITIYGHTDSSGNAKSNQRLSELRAKAVASYLRKAENLSQPIKAVGVGSSEPRASNDTAEGRKQNRRIEFKVSPLEIAPAVTE